MERQERDCLDRGHFALLYMRLRFNVLISIVTPKIDMIIANAKIEGWQGRDLMR